MSKEDKFNLKPNRIILKPVRSDRRNERQFKYIDNVPIILGQGYKRSYSVNSEDNHESKFQKYTETRTKNIAARRLQNLRSNLQKKIQQEELNKFKKNPNIGPSNIKSYTNLVTSTSLSKCVSNPNQDQTVAVDSMDWSPLNDATVVQNVNEIRKEINYSYLLVNNNLVAAFNTITTQSSVHVVVDSNVFLNQLAVISELVGMSFKSINKVTIIAPWMVIQELDYMKDSNRGNCMCKAAQKAIKYINKQLTDKSPQFKGQSALEASKYNLSSNNPDDGILFCCLQLVEQQKKVVLLSNDVNLRNKALIHDIEAYGSNEIINKLNQNESTDTTDCRSIANMKMILSNVLTLVIESEMKEAYGDMWQRVTSMHPPFTTEEATNCLQKYWRSVFSISVQKQCKRTIDDFKAFLYAHRFEEYLSGSNFKKFVEYALSLCIYLKNAYDNYKNQLSNCISNIQKCAE